MRLLRQDVRSELPLQASAWPPSLQRVTPALRLSLVWSIALAIDAHTNRTKKRTVQRCRNFHDLFARRTIGEGEVVLSSILIAGKHAMRVNTSWAGARRDSHSAVRSPPRSR